MDLNQQLQQQLSPLVGGPATVTASTGGLKVVCGLASVDSLGVLVERLELQAARLEGLTTERLREIADELARRVRYLLEAIAPIEADAEGCSVQMRSVPPYRKENVTSYYEVLVTAGKISLKRYKKGRGELRQGEPYALTREVLFRLVDDFAAAAASV